jgi:hypothetical protein
MTFTTELGDRVQLEKLRDVSRIQARPLYQTDDDIAHCIEQVIALNNKRMSCWDHASHILDVVNDDLKRELRKLRPYRATL